MKKNDFTMAIVIVALAVSFFLGRTISASRSGIVTVYKDSDVLMEVPLNKDDTFTVLYYDEEDNGGQNIVRVSGGKVSVISADCPDQLCVNQGKISKSGESIICLPHHMTITIEKGENREVDAVSGR